MNEVFHHPPGLRQLLKFWRQLLAVWAMLMGLAAAQPICTVSVTPAAPQTFQAVRASVAGLSSGFTGPLTLDWGDGSSTPFTPAQAGNIAKPAPYSTSGTRTVSVLLSTRPLCTTTVSVSTAPVTFGVTPSSGPVTTTFVAAYSGLPFTTLYTLNWGDGTTQQISTPGSGSSSHTYAAPGIYTVTFGSFSAAPMTAIVTVTAPAQAPTLSVTPASAAVGQTVTASVTDAAGYSLDWGDGTPPFPPTARSRTATRQQAPTP
ncbi:PKD domain-containing protein (plasmid) [Deinococcus sp. KNUC1210]|uniref:PKD domain-containing protein n=1 Tax=Deinococcus sp. KNUC1210 TaxID=2917691 RepID=UPI001EF0C2F3|nr:PKD domain-containing protein [Deinococcus sp. KNUC1210]ULH16966.1 PKD domain-containing protein [Deinococcus sp. KNUC1210]